MIRTFIGLATLFSINTVLAAPVSPIFRNDEPLPQESAPNPAEKKTSQQHWADTGIKLNHFLDDAGDTCKDSLRTFTGCWEALSTLLEQITPGSTLAFDSEVQQKSPILGKRTEKLHPDFGMYATATPEGSQKDALSKYREIRNSALRQHFESQIKIKWNHLFEKHLKEFLKKEPQAESWLVGQLYNSYLAKTDDPHSRLVPASEEAESMSSENKNFKGIGVMVREFNKNLIIHRVYEGSPAQTAGIRRNDVVVRINGQSTENLEVRKALKLLSQPGDQVTLELKRNDQLIPFTLTREEVFVPTVQTGILDPVQSASGKTLKTGFIRITDFMDQDMPEQFMRAVFEMKVEGTDSLIIDLQNNGGGLLTSAALLGAFFTHVHQTIFGISPVDFAGTNSLSTNLAAGPDFFSLNKLILQSTPPNKLAGAMRALKEFPSDRDSSLVILQNSSSASASELLAGALQDHQRAWVAGETSFGKGTVQGVADFPFKSYHQNNRNPKIVYRKTIQRFYQPSGRTNQIQGIIPNFEIRPEPAFREADYFEGAVPAIEKPWVESRPELVQKINLCREQMKYAEDRYEAEMNGNEGLENPDYRAFAAQEILSCGN